MLSVLEALTAAAPAFAQSTNHLDCGLARQTQASPPAAAAAGGLGSTLWRALVDEIGVGLVLTDGSGVVLHANRAARRWCDATAPLQLNARLLHTSDPAQAHTLAQALVRARQWRRTMMTFQRQHWADTVCVVPLTPDDASQTPAVLFMLGSRGEPQMLGLQFFCQAHKLTLAESAVLTALQRGLSPAQVASDGGVTVATVRSQISAIRGKTHAANLGHLQRMLAALPPMAQAASS